jgi:hypothetical protein
MWKGGEKSSNIVKPATKPPGLNNCRTLTDVGRRTTELSCRGRGLLCLGTVYTEYTGLQTAPVRELGGGGEGATYEKQLGRHKV